MEINVLRALLPQFAGGELEVQNPLQGYYYRGRIAHVDFVEASDGFGPRFSVTLAWQVYAPMAGRRQIGQLSEVYDPTKLVYDIDATLPFADDSAPGGTVEKPPFSNIGPSEEGGGDRLFMSNPYTGEAATFFPPDGSKLDPANVPWLPDGPYSRFTQQ